VSYTNVCCTEDTTDRKLRLEIEQKNKNSAVADKLRHAFEYVDGYQNRE